MTITQDALRSRQVGEYAPARELRVAGVKTDFVRVLGGYLASGGGVLEIEGADLDGAEGERVEFDIGYGSASGSRLLNYFAGDIESVDEETGAATVYGPLKGMGEQRLLRQANYGGWYLEDALTDLAYNRDFGTPIPPGALEIRSGRSYLIGTTPPLGEAAQDAAAIFPLETTRQEAMESLTGSAGFYLGERPGYRVLAMPTPRPGATAKAKAVYTEDDYPSEETGGLKITGTRTSYYAGVLVFRRNEGGVGYGAWAYAPVENHARIKPPANKVYLIPEFPGGDAEAEQVAYDKARALVHGVKPGTLEGLAADPSVLMHDAIEVYRTKEVRRERFRERYSCQIDTEHSVEATADSQDMALGFSALLLERKLLPASFFFSSDIATPAVVETGIVAVAGLKPDAGLKPGLTLKPERQRQQRVYS